MSKEGSGREGDWRSRKDKEMAFGARERFHREEGVPLPLYLAVRGEASLGQRVEGLEAGNESSQAIASLFSKR